MINARTWWGWGSYDTDPHLQPQSQIDALEAPILEGSDPRVLSPSYLLTAEQIRDTRLDAIVGGCVWMPRSRLLPGQATEIGAYWRRAQDVERMGHEASARMAATIAGITFDRGGIRWDSPFTANRPRARAGASPTIAVEPSAPAPAPAPGVTTDPSSAPQRAPMAPPKPGRLGPPRMLARPWPAGKPAAPLPRPRFVPPWARPTTPRPAAPPASASPPPTSATHPPTEPTAEAPAEVSRPPMVGPDETIQALAQLEELIAWLATLTPEGLAAAFTQTPELVSLLVDLGYLDPASITAAEPTEIGEACCEDCARANAYEAAGAIRVGDFWADVAQTVAQVDQQVLSPVWDAAKGFVPYGQQIDQLHQARLRALGQARPDLYPAPSSTKSASASRKDATIRDLQSLSRGVRRGDVQAEQTAKTLKERAEQGDPDARRRWSAYVTISLDDERRLEEGRA